MKFGKLIVNVGSMFSGKSTELLRQGKRYELAGKRVLYVKPAVDGRYSDTEIVTHDSARVASVVLADEHDLAQAIQIFGAHAVCIDEGQFFGFELVPNIDLALRNGVDVFVSGLDMDRHGEPFGIMPYLMAVADDVKKFKAVCAGCGEDAYVSFGEFEAADQVAVGGAEKYKPLCRGCAYKRNPAW